MQFLVSAYPLADTRLVSLVVLARPGFPVPVLLLTSAPSGAIWRRSRPHLRQFWLTRFSATSFPQWICVSQRIHSDSPADRNSLTDAAEQLLHALAALHAATVRAEGLPGVVTLEHHRWRVLAIRRGQDHVQNSSQWGNQ